MWSIELGWKSAIKEYKIQSNYNLHLIGVLGPTSFRVQHRQQTYYFFSLIKLLFQQLAYL